MKRGLFAFGLAVFLFAVMLGSVSLGTPTVRAQDPTLDAAMQAIWQATRSAQQTRDARDQDAANQRATAAAIENARSQADVDATRSAYATRQIVEATATRQAMDAQQTRERQAANATATQASAYANATASQASINVEGTRAAYAATATTDALRTQQTRTAVNATATIESIHADATRAAIQLQQESETRDAAIRSIAFGLGALIGVLLLIVAGGIAVRAFWRATTKRDATRVATVVEAASAPTPREPLFVDAAPVTLTQIAYNPDPDINARAGQITLDLIARQMEQGQNCDAQSSDDDTPDVIDGQAVIE